MDISEVVIWFALGSLGGWLFESAYCAITSGTWENRGFLIGPICPIYGVGVAAGLVLFSLLPVADGTFPWWGVFLASALSSALLEYATSCLLEKAFGTVWWDYGNMPFNVNGRVCLPATILFGFGGMAVAYLILPIAQTASEVIPDDAFQAIALVVVALVSFDMALTLDKLSDLVQKVDAFDEEFNRIMEDTYRSVAERTQAIRSALPRLDMGQLRMLNRMKRFRTDKLRKAVDHMRKAVKDAAARGEHE